MCNSKVHVFFGPIDGIMNNRKCVILYFLHNCMPMNMLEFPLFHLKATFEKSASIAIYTPSSERALTFHGTAVDTIKLLSDAIKFQQVSKSITIYTRIDWNHLSLRVAMTKLVSLWWMKIGSSAKLLSIVVRFSVSRTRKNNERFSYGVQRRLFQLIPNSMDGLTAQIGLKHTISKMSLWFSLNL